MASTNKFLAQMNKTQDVGRATEGCSALQSLLVQSGKGRIASDPALLNLPRPLMVGAFLRPWQRRTNFWRGKTNLRTGAERLTGVIRRLDPKALAFFGPGHLWW